MTTSINAARNTLATLIESAPSRLTYAGTQGAITAGVLYAAQNTSLLTILPKIIASTSPALFALTVTSALMAQYSIKTVLTAEKGSKNYNTGLPNQSFNYMANLSARAAAFALASFMLTGGVSLIGAGAYAMALGLNTAVESTLQLNRPVLETTHAYIGSSKVVNTIPKAIGSFIRPN